MKRLKLCTFGILVIAISILFLTFTKPIVIYAQNPYPPPLENKGFPNLEESQYSHPIYGIDPNAMYPVPQLNNNQVPFADWQGETFRIYIPYIRKPYDRTKAVAYADQWAHDRNPEFPVFGTSGACNDCTNYLSQTIMAGGFPLKPGNWDEDSPFDWWVRDTFWPWEAKNSKTWSATDWFNIYVTQYQNEYKYYDYVLYQQSGDFMLMDLRGANQGTPPDGIPDHARIFVGFDQTSTDQNDYLDGNGFALDIPPSEVTWLTNQHCVDRQHIAYDYNLNSTIPIWYWHVIL